MAQQIREALLPELPLAASTMIKPIIFYDIPSTVKIKAWSPNTWKTRYVLNFKKLPYKTVWVEYPDIEKVCKEIGALPGGTRKNGEHYYSLPAIQDPNTNAVVSDSYRIAEYLEKTYPESPKLFPKGSEGLQAAFYDLYSETVPGALQPLMIKLIHSILHPPSQAYIRKAWEPVFGKKLENLGEGAEEQWEIFKAAHSKVAALYDKNGAGHFIQGDGITYGDINVASFFVWYGFSTNGESEEWKKMLTWDNGKWARLVEALKPYESVIV